MQNSSLIQVEPVLDSAAALRCAYQDLCASTDLAAAAKCLKALGEGIGMPHPAVIGDYSSNRLLTVEDGRALTSVLGWNRAPVTSWIRQRLNLVSPIAAVCRISTQPFAWDAQAVAEAVYQQRGGDSIQWPLTPAHGFFGGITVPVHMPRGRTGSVSWYSREAGVEVASVLTRHSDLLRLAALRFLDLAYARRAEPIPQEDTSAHLSDRELECLTWAALGRTDVEIGAVIHRAPATARFHIDNAVRKLDARNRTQAVAIAVQQGLIQPVDPAAA